MAWEKSKVSTVTYAKDWADIRKRVLIKANWKCVLKWEGCLIGANEVDHIDGDIENNDPSNLRALCSECHFKVTMKNRQKARLIKNPRQTPYDYLEVVDGVQKTTEDIDDIATDNEDEWITSFGPVFEKLEDGKYKQPEKTLGKHVIAWMMKNLKLKGKPFRPTKDQARIIMWMYAIDKNGVWLYDRVLHVAPKGWGKDPFAACLLALELCGGARFSHWDDKGNPVPKRVENAWCQIAAVRLTQNENTMQVLREIFTPEAMVRYQIEIQSWTIYAFNRQSKIEAVSSGSAGMEGNTISFAVLMETHWWTQENRCLALFNVIQRNLRKMSGSHWYSGTNAWNPNMMSVAQRQYDGWIAAQDKGKETKLLLVMKSATHKAPRKTMEQRIKVLKKVYGSSSAYTDLEQIASGFDDDGQDESEQIRFYYNTVGIPSEAWINIQLWKACKNPKYDSKVGIPKGSRILLAGDMSKNDDASVLVGIVTEGPLAGTIFTVGVWEKPLHLKGEAADSWQVPREEVDAAVIETFRNYHVEGFWVDPSHKMNTEGGEGGSYWMPLLDEWHRRYSRQILPSMWAKGTEHAINWDMTSHSNQRTFVEGLGTFKQMIEDKQIYNDGNTDMIRHIRNAHRYKSLRFGETVAKESPRSKKKIDLLVGACLSFIMYQKLSTHRKTINNQQKGYSVPERRN
jgi:hypothetical protein